MAQYGNAYRIGSAQAARYPNRVWRQRRRQEALLDRLVRLCGFSVLWTTEDPYEVATNTQLAQSFDLVFFNDASCVEPYGARGNHLALADAATSTSCNPSRTTRISCTTYCSSGDAWPNRVKQIRDIIGVGRTRSEVQGRTAGQSLPARTEARRSASDHRLAGASRSIYPLANRSRITLGLTRVFSTDATSKAQGSTPPPRIFEVAAAGAFQLIENLSGELGNYFKLGKELVACRNAEEFAEEIRYYLSHPVERLRITEAAQAAAFATIPMTAASPRSWKRLTPVSASRHRTRDPFRRAGGRNAFYTLPTMSNHVATSAVWSCTSTT